jgi:1A family penicillin-binding protein
LRDRLRRVASALGRLAVFRFLRRLDRKSGAIIALSGILFGFTILAYYAFTLPLPDGFAQEERRPSLLLQAPNGETIASRGKFMGEVLSFDDIPPDLVKALVAIEDRRFYGHFGIDLIGTARAAVTNLMAGEIRQGGSTITQQLAKVTFLSPERSFKRKIQEAMLALWLENRLSKDEILLRYLNKVYFGAGAYGVDGAARRYFRKSARALDLSEAAMLAGLVRSPSSLAPTRNLEGAQARAQLVLNAMVATGVLEEDRAVEARAAPATLAVAPDGDPGSNYFADWVERETQRLFGSLSADLVVDATLDPQLQDLGEQVVIKWLEAQGGVRKVDQGALVAMTPDGAVLAMVGGKDYGESQFNRVTQAKRQPGSLFKLFVYLAAFDAGLTPDSVMTDRPIEIDGWRPQNYSGEHRGEVTLRTAFAESINSVAAQLAQQVGPERVIGVAQRMGVSSPLQATGSIALGASEVTLLEMTAAYAAMAGDVKRVQPYGIRRIHDQSRSLYSQEASASRSEKNALPWRRAEMIDLLSTTIRSGTGKAAAFDRPAAGKTGTSQDYRDAWFIGFTADLVVGVWLGNDDGEPMAGVAGGGLPAKIWRDFMIQAYALKGIGAPETARQDTRANPDSQRQAAATAADQEGGSALERLGRSLRSFFR